MYELLSTDVIVWRVLRDHFHLPEKTPILVLFEWAARSQGIPNYTAAARVDYEYDYLDRGICAAYVLRSFREALNKQAEVVIEA